MRRILLLTLLLASSVWADPGFILRGAAESSATRELWLSATTTTCAATTTTTLGGCVDRATGERECHDLVCAPTFACDVDALVARCAEACQPPPASTIECQRSRTVKSDPGWRVEKLHGCLRKTPIAP